MRMRPSLQVSVPLSAPLAYAGAFLSGILYWLAFPGIDAWPLTFVAWVPVLIAMEGQSVRRSALLAGLSGLTMNVAGFFWLQTMLMTFSGFNAAICFFFVLVVCSYQGGRVALLGWLYGRATARGWPRAPVFALAFIASELVFPLLFPWYYAATVHRVPVLTQTGDLGGPILIGLVLVAANLAIAELALAAIQRRPIVWTTPAVGAATVVLASLYGAIRVNQIDALAAAAPASTVGIVQANMGLMEKRTDYNEGLRRHMALSASLHQKGADFLVWSETSAMHAVRDDTYKGELRNLARQIGLPTVFGAVVVKRVEDEREYVLYNTAITSDADGTIEGRYDKQYLLTFGEYLPFGDSFPILYRWSPNSGHFSPGTSLDPLLLDVKGEKHAVSALICYEDVLPRFTNDAVRHANPDLLVNITNDAWFGDTAEPWEHLGLAELRAVEHHRYFVRGTNSGISAVIDPVGRVVAHSGSFRQDTVLAPIHWLRVHTLYEILGDWPWLLASCAAFALAFWRRPRPPVGAPAA
jgi:apolipoprotein N-acyltransferase